MFKLQEINFDEDWKLLTVLIGMNDICDYCKDKVECSRRSMCNLVLFFSLRPSPSSVFLVFHTVSVLSGELHPLHGHVPGDADEWGRQISIKTFYICKNKHKWSLPIALTILIVKASAHELLTASQSTSTFSILSLQKKLTLSLPSGSSYDCECGSDFTHVDIKRGAEAHAWLSTPEVLYMYCVDSKKQDIEKKKTC